MNPLIRFTITVALLLFLAMLTQDLLRLLVNPILQSPLEKEPSIEVRGAVVVGRQGGEKVWEFRAPFILVGEQKREVAYRGEGEGTVFRGGKPFLYIRAPFIKLDLVTKDAHVLGGVTLRVAEGGTTMFTKELHWQGQKGILTAPYPLRILAPEGAYEADSMDGDLNTGEIRLNHMRGKMSVPLQGIPGQTP